MELPVVFIVFCSSVTFFLYCWYFYGKKQQHGSRVSIARPTWCPTNVNCEDHMKEMVRNSILQHITDQTASKSRYFLYEQFALESVLKHRNRSELYGEEIKLFAEVFRREFRHCLPFLMIAKSEGKSLKDALNKVKK